MTTTIGAGETQFIQFMNDLRTTNSLVGEPLFMAQLDYTLYLIAFSGCIYCLDVGCPFLSHVG